MASADPLDHLCRISLARGAGMCLSVEVIRDLGISQTVRQFTDAINNRGRIPKAVGDVGRKLHGEVGAGASLPAEVNKEKELLLIG